MKLCKNSIDGSKCSKYFTCKDDHVDIKSLVQSELESQRKGNQWPLSSFGPFAGKPSFPDYIEDQSFEEIRSMYYDSNMTFIQSAQKFFEAINNAVNKMETLLSINSNVINKLANIYDMPEKHFSTRNDGASQNSVFNSWEFPFAHTKSVFGPVPHQSKKWVLSGTLQEQDQPIFGRWPKTYKINCEIVGEDVTLSSDFFTNRYKLIFSTNNMQHRHMGTFGSSQMNSNAFGFPQMQNELNAMSTQQKHQQGTSMLFGCSQQEHLKKQQNTSNVFGCSQQQQAHGFANSQLMQKGTSTAFGVPQDEHKPQDSNIKFGCPQQEQEKKQQITSNVFGCSQQLQAQKGTPTAFGAPQNEQKPHDSNIKFGCPQQEHLKKQQNTSNVFGCSQQQQAHGFANSQLMQKGTSTAFGVPQDEHKPQDSNIKFGCPQLEREKKQQNTSNVFGCSQQLQAQKVTPTAFGAPQNEQKPHDSNIKFGCPQQEQEKKHQNTSNVFGCSQQQQAHGFANSQLMQKGTSTAFGVPQDEHKPQDSNIEFGCPQQEQAKKQQNTSNVFGCSQQLQAQKGPPTAFGAPQNEQTPQDSNIKFGCPQQEQEKKQQNTSNVFGCSQQQQLMQKGTSTAFGVPQDEHKPQDSNIEFGCPQQEQEKKQQITSNVFGCSQQLQAQKVTPTAFGAPQNEQKPQDRNRKFVPVEEKIRQQQELEKVEAQTNQQQTTGPTFGSSQVVQEQEKLNLQQNQPASNGILLGLPQNQTNAEIQGGVLGSSKLQPNIFGTTMHNTNLFGTPNHGNSFGNINPSQTGQRIGSLCVQPYGHTGMYGIRPPQQLQAAPSVGLSSFGAAAPGLFNGTQSSITGHQYDTCKPHLQEISSKLDGFLKVVKEKKSIFEKEKNEINRIFDLLQSWNNISGGAPSTNIEDEHRLIIKPKYKQCSESTKNYLKTTVDPLVLSAQIYSVSNGPNGSVFIKCKDEGSAEKLQSNLNAYCEQTYDISLKVLRNPRIIVTGIDDQIEDNQLIEIIQKQNNLHGEMELINRIQTTSNTSYQYSAVIKVDKDFHEQLLKGKFPHLNIGWNKCLVEKIENPT